MKHLERFQNFNYQQINEEEGILAAAALAASLLFNNVNTNPQQV